MHRGLVIRGFQFPLRLALLETALAAGLAAGCDGDPSVCRSRPRPIVEGRFTGLCDSTRLATTRMRACADSTRNQRHYVRISPPTAPPNSIIPPAAAPANR